MKWLYCNHTEPRRTYKTALCYIFMSYLPMHTWLGHMHIRDISGGSGWLLSFLGFILWNSLTYMVFLTLALEMSSCGHLSYVRTDLLSQSPSVSLAPLCTFPSVVPPIHRSLQHEPPPQLLCSTCFLYQWRVNSQGTRKVWKKEKRESLSLYLWDPGFSCLEVTSSWNLFVMRYSSEETPCNSLNLGFTLLPMYQASTGGWELWS